MRLRSTWRLFSTLALSAQLVACSKSGGSATADAAPALVNPGDKTCSTALSSKSYFEDIQTSMDLKKPVSEPASIRERTVKIDLEALRADLLAGAATLKLDFFSDKTIQVTVEKIQKTTNGIVVTGRLADQPLSSVTLAIEKNVVILNVIATSGSNYHIIYRGNGVHVIQESSPINEDDDNENSCQAMEAPAEDVQELQTRAAATANSSPQALSAAPVIDMLVAYTPAAVAAAGGEDAIKATIQTGIANTNKAFQDSNVNLSVRLVGTMAVSQNESADYSTDLTALKGKTDGKWDEVHAERARLGADQVTLVGEYAANNSVWGIGYTNAGPSSAFTTVKLYAFRIYTLAHELGHNIGLQHSDGYVNTSGNFRTIMAYGSQPRITRYSNPSLNYNGYTTGTSSNNSAAILNANGATVAGFVASKVPANPETVPVVSSPTPSPTPNSPISGGCTN